MKKIFGLGFFLFLLTVAGHAASDNAAVTSSVDNIATGSTGVATPNLSLYRNIDPKWEFIVGVGQAVPLTSNLESNYNQGVDFGLGVGYQAAKPFSIWMNLDGAPFTAKTSATVNGNGFLLGDLSLWARWDLGNPDDFHPYFFAGPGIAINEYYNYYTLNGLSAQTNIYEGDLLLEAGLGFELTLENKKLALFIQSKFVYDNTSANFANYGGTDNPMEFITIQAGLKLKNF